MTDQSQFLLFLFGLRLRPLAEKEPWLKAWVDSEQSRWQFCLARTTTVSILGALLAALVFKENLVFGAIMWLGTTTVGGIAVWRASPGILSRMSNYLNSNSED
jgi:hypothetical protein